VIDKASHKIKKTMDLFEATGVGDVDAVRAALAAGANVDEIDDDDATPLIDVSESGHADVVRVLLAAGADVDKVSVIGWTAMMYASSNGQQENGADDSE
jgi:ankyrin repeat protein